MEKQQALDILSGRIQATLEVQKQANDAYYGPGGYYDQIHGRAAKPKVQGNQFSNWNKKPASLISIEDAVTFGNELLISQGIQNNIQGDVVCHSYDNTGVPEPQNDLHGVSYVLAHNLSGVPVDLWAHFLALGNAISPLANIASLRTLWNSAKGDYEKENELFERLWPGIDIAAFRSRQAAWRADLAASQPTDPDQPAFASLFMA